MKRTSFVASAIYVIAFLLIIAGVIFVVVGITSGATEAIYGIGVLVTGFLVWGYAFIVEAALKYLDS